MHLIYFISLILLTNSYSTPDSYEYIVDKIDGTIILSGKGSDSQWEKANTLNSFTYPWRDETPPATQFKALWNETHFYFLYHANDPEIIAPEHGLGEMDAVNSDRVEIFLKADDHMDPYYALEMDALGRCFDSKGKFYRKGDHEWDWPDNHLAIQASKDAQGYWVEGSITFESLIQLGMYKNDGLLLAGLYRGEYFTNEKSETGIKWISWVLPDSEKPDFHIPSSFGQLKLGGWQ